jgi:hypothetical protein
MVPGTALADRQVIKALQDTLMPHLTSLTELTLEVGCATSLRSCFKQRMSSMVGLQKLSSTEGATGAIVFCSGWLCAGTGLLYRDSHSTAAATRAAGSWDRVVLSQ